MTQDVIEPAANIPDGFRPLRIGGEFVAVNGPLYLRHEGDLVQLGFRVEPRHCNPMSICHGGMLANFCDMLLPVTVHRKSSEVGRRFLPTVSLQLDYLAPSALGAWVCNANRSRLCPTHTKPQSIPWARARSAKISCCGAGIAIRQSLAPDC